MHTVVVLASDQERHQGNHEAKSVVTANATTNSVQLHLRTNASFSFDFVVSSSSSSSSSSKSSSFCQSVYAEAVWPNVKAFLDGRCVDVVAFGASHLGKSDALLALVKQQQGQLLPSGLIPQTLNDIFDSIDSYSQSHMGEKPSFKVSLSLLEVLNEDVFDLLKDPADLQDNDAHVILHDDADLTTDVECVGASIIDAKDARDAIKYEFILTKAINNRKSTTRSHLIYTINLRQHHHDPETIISSRLKFFDLASCSRNISPSSLVHHHHHEDDVTANASSAAVSSSMAHDSSVLLNSGLLALRNIVLHDSTTSNTLDYRQSKLTMLLKSFLVKGNSNTDGLLISFISPLESNVHETLHTLKFTTRASKIHRQLIDTTNVQETQVSALKELVDRLKSENSMLRSGAKPDDILSENNDLRLELELKNQEIVKLKAQCNYLTNELSLIQNESTLKMYNNNIGSFELDDFSDTDSIASTVTYTESIAESDVTATSAHSTTTPTSSATRLPSMSRTSTSATLKPKAISTKLPPTTKPGTNTAAARRTSNSSTISTTSSRRSSATISHQPPTISRSKSEPPVNPSAATTNTCATLTQQLQVAAKRTKRLTNELRQMTQTAQDYYTLSESLQAQVKSFEKEQSRDVREFVKASEDAALHKVEVLTAKLEKVEKAYNSAEEYINGLEAELVRQEDIVAKVEKLEDELKAAHEAEEKRTALLKVLEERLDVHGDHVSKIERLEAASSVKHGDGVVVEKSIAPISSDDLAAAIARAKEAEDKLAFIYASSEEDVDFGDSLLVSSDDFNKATGEGQHGFVHNVMNRFGWSDNETVDDLKSRLKKAQEFNGAVRGDVELLKARIKVLSQQKSPKRSRSVHFGAAVSEVACQSDTPQDTRGPVFELQKLLNEAYAEKDLAVAKYETELAQLQTQHSLSKSSVETLTAEHAAQITRLEAERKKLQLDLVEASIKAEDTQNKVFVLQSQLEKALRASPKPVSKDLAAPALAESQQLKDLINEKQKALKVAEETIRTLKWQLDVSNDSLEVMRCEVEKAPPKTLPKSVQKTTTRDVEIQSFTTPVTRDVEIQFGVGTRTVEVQSDVDAVQFSRFMSLLKTAGKGLEIEKEKVSSLESKNKDLEKELETAHAKLNEQQEKDRAHQKSISLSSANAQHPSLGLDDDEKLMLKAEIADLKTRLAGLQELKSKLLDTATRYHTHDEMTTAVSQIEALTKQIQSLTETHEIKVARLSKDIDEKDMSLKVALETLEQCQRELRQMELELGTTRVEIEKLQSLLDKSEKEASTVNDMYNASLKGVVELEMRLAEVHSHFDILIRRLTLDGESMTTVLTAQVFALEAKKAEVEYDFKIAQKALEEERVGFENAFSSWKAELEAIKATLESTLSELSVSTAEHVDCKNMLAETSSKLAQVEELLAAEVSAHNSTKEQAGADRANYKDRVVSLEKDLVDVKSLHEAEVLIHKSAAEQLSKEKSVVAETLSVHQDRAISLEAELDSIKALHQKEVLAHKSTVERSVSDLSVKTTEHSDRVASLEKELERVKALQQADADSKVQMLEADLKATRNELVAEKVRLDEAVAALETKLSTVNGTLSVITAQYTASSTECEELRAELADTIQELNEVENLLDAEIDAHSQTKDTYQAELNSAYDAAKLEVSTLQRELEDVRSRQKTTVAETVNEVELRLESVQKHADVLCSKLISEHQVTLGLFVEASEKIVSLESRLVEIQGYHDNVVASISKEHDATRELHSTATDRVRDLEKALASADQSSTIVSLHKNLNDARSELAASVGHVNELEAALDLSIKSNAETVEALNKDLSASFAQRDAALSRVNELQDALVTLQRDNTEAVATADTQSNELKLRLETVTSEYSVVVSRLESELESMRKLLSDATSTIAATELRSNQEKDTNAAVVAKLESANRELSTVQLSLTERIKSLEHQLVQLRDEHDARVNELEGNHQITRELHSVVESKARDLSINLDDLMKKHDVTVARLEVEHQATRDLHVASSNEASQLKLRLMQLEEEYALLKFEIQTTREARLDDKIVELEMRLEQVQKHHHTLLDALGRDHETVLEGLSSQLEFVEREVLEGKNWITRLEAELQMTKDLLAAANGQAARLESLLGLSQVQYEADITQRDLTNAELNNVQNVLNDRIMELEFELSDASAAFARQLAQARDDHLATRDIHLAKAKDLELNIENLQNGHAETVSRLQQEIHNSQSLYTGAIDEVNLLKSQLQQAEVDRLQAITQVTREIQSTTESQASKTILELEARLEAVQKQNHFLMESISFDAQSLLAALEKEVDILTFGNQNLSKDLNQLVAAKVANEAQLSELSITLANLKAELATQVSEHINARSALSSDNGDLLKQLGDLSELKTLLEQRVAALNAELSNLHQLLQEKDIQLQEQVESANIRVKELEASHQDLKNQFSTSLTVLQTEHQSTKDLHLAAVDRARSLETNLAEAQRQHSSLLSTFENVQVSRDVVDPNLEVSELRNIVKQLEEHRDILIRRLKYDEDVTAGLYSTANDRIKELEARLDRMNDQHAKLISGLDQDHKTAINAFMARISETEKAHTALTMSNLSLEKQCSFLSEVKAGNEKRIDELEAELKNLRPALVTKERELQETVSQHQASRDLHAVASSRVSDLEARLVDTHQKYEAALLVKERELNDLSSSHQKTRELHISTSTKVEELEFLLNLAKQKNDKSVGDLTEVQELYAGALAKIEELESRLHDGQKYHETFMSRLETARDLHNGAQNDASELEQRLKSVEIQHDVFVSKLVEDHLTVVAFLQVQITAYVSELESTKVILDKKSKELELAERNAVTLRDVAVKKMDISEHNQMMSKLQSRFARLEGELELSQTIVAELTEKLRNGADAETLKNLWFKLDKEEDEGRKKSAEISRLEERINELLYQIADFRDTNARIPELEFQLSSLTQQHETERSLHSMTVVELNKWRDASNFETERNKSKENELSNLRYQCSMLISEKQAMERSLNQLSAEVNRLNTVVIAHETHAQTITDQSEEIETLARDLESALAQAAKTSNQLSKSALEHSTEKQQFQVLIENLQKDLTGVSENYAKLQSEMADLKLQHESSLRDFSVERSKASVLQAELDVLKSTPLPIARDIQSTTIATKTTTSEALEDSPIATTANQPSEVSSLKTTLDSEEKNTRHQNELEIVKSRIPAETAETVTTSKDIQVVTTASNAVSLPDNYTTKVANVDGTSSTVITTLTKTTTEEVILDSGTSSRKVRVLTPEESTLFSAFKHVSDEHWNLISQELIEKNDRIKDLEAKLELVAAIPEILKKWEETFLEQETDIEQLEKELAEAQAALKQVHESQVLTTTTTTKEVVSVPQTTERSILVDEHTHTETVLLHPEFEAVSLELEEKNQLIVDLQFRLEKLSAIPEILKSWENAFRAQEADIDQLEAELDQAYAQIKKLQAIANTKSPLNDSNDSGVDVMSHRVTPVSRGVTPDAAFSPNMTFVQSANSTPNQPVNGTFEIAYNHETGEYYFPDSNSFGYETASVGAHEYIEVLRQHITQLERALGESRSRIMNLQTKVSNLELSNSEYSLRVSRARADLIEVTTAKRLLEARLERVKDRSICGSFGDH
ncbi:UNVERIFIED_CONTAM: Chromosome-associated kinesin kif4a [Siphonaria sp. JEL0065]|nr:Chromosome-associated kinesin kif4a [Siphonaria sp. JEL0065]